MLSKINYRPHKYDNYLGICIGAQIRCRTVLHYLYQSKTLWNNISQVEVRDRKTRGKYDLIKVNDNIEIIWLITLCSRDKWIFANAQILHTLFYTPWFSYSTDCLRFTGHTLIMRSGPPTSQQYKTRSLRIRIFIDLFLRPCSLYN